MRRFTGKGGTEFRTKKNIKSGAEKSLTAFSKGGKKKQKRTSIQIISEAVSKHRMPYTVFVTKLRDAGIVVARKTLANMATKNPGAFNELLEKVKMRGPIWTDDPGPSKIDLSEHKRR